jgi:hypothetical protein
MRSRSVPIAALALITVGAVADWVWLSALASFAALAVCMPGPTLARRAVVAVSTYVGVTSMAFTVLSVCHLRTDLRWLVLGVGIATVVAAAVAGPVRVRLADSVDVWSAATSVLVVMVVARNGFRWGPADIIARLASHTDGVRHITLGAAVNDHGGYLTLAGGPDHLLPGLKHYPQGSSGLLAIVLRSLAGEHPDVGITALIGFWVLVSILGLTTWVITTLVILLARRASPKPLGSREVAAACLVIVATGALGPEYLTYELGYFAQQVATLALLSSMCLLVEVPWRGRLAATLALLLVCVAQSWYLLTPIFAVVAGLWWWRQPRRRLMTAPLAVAAPFVAFPFVTGPSPTKQLVAVGITPTPNEIVVSALVIGGIVAAFVLHRVGRRGECATLLRALVVILAFMLLVGAMELMRASADSAYYAVKMFVLLLMFGAIAMGAATALTLATRDGRDRVLAGAMLIAAMATVVGGFSYFHGKTIDPAPRAVREAQTYLDLVDHHDDRAIIVAYDGCGVRDRFLSHAMANLSMEFSPQFIHDMATFMNSDGANINGLTRLARDPQVPRLEVVTYSPCAPQRVAELAKLPHVTVIDASESCRDHDCPTLQLPATFPSQQQSLGSPARGSQSHASDSNSLTWRVQVHSSVTHRRPVSPIRRRASRSSSSS